MTVASEVSRSGPYNGNGVTTVFDYDFRIVNEAHLKVIRADADANETVLVLGADYTVSGVGADEGSITASVAPAIGLTITILRNVPLTQETDLENQGPYFAETVEAAFDLAAMRDQQLQEQLTRAILVPASEDDPGGVLAGQLAQDITRLAQSADEIDTVAAIDEDVVTVAGIAGDVALLADVSAVLSGTASAVRMDEKMFTGDGVDTTWTLDREPGVEENVLVWVGGAIQDTADYSVVGTTLTISPAVANGVEIRTLIMTLVTANDVEQMRDETEEARDEAVEAKNIAVAAATSIATLVAFGADPTGSVDITAAIQAAVNSGLKSVRATLGNYKIGSNFTVPSGFTIDFRDGGKFNISTGVQLTWNGGIVASPFQPIFEGDLVQSSYQTNSLTPYVLGVIGDPEIDRASPFWFGAKGNNIDSDYNAFAAVLGWARRVHIPGLPGVPGLRKYYVHTSIPVRKSGQKITGDGITSWVQLRSSIPTGVGQLIGIAGLLPTVSGGLPAAFVENVEITGVHIDTNGGTNDNGIGGSFVKNTKVRDCYFTNVGRKAVTWQYHVHNNSFLDSTIFSASMEAGGTQSAISTEGENSSFSYANGVAGFDWNGDDNTDNTFQNIEIVQSGYSGITISNAKRTFCDNIRITTLGALGRPVIVGRASKDNTFRSIKVKTSTRGFLIVTSATTTSTRFQDCWVDDCSGDNMFYSEGPGTTFENCGGTQTDDRIAWSIRGADCKIIDCRALFTAITAATQASSLFSTAARFKMRGCYVDSVNALRGFGGSTAADIELSGNTFTGGVTDGISVSGNNAHVNDNIIGGNASGRVRVGSGASGVNVHDNTLTGGASATIDWANTADLWASGAKYNNSGDVSTYHCMRFGVRIDGSYGGTPEAVIAAAVGSTIRDTVGGNVYRKGSGSGNTGWVAM